MLKYLTREALVCPRYHRNECLPVLKGGGSIGGGGGICSVALVEATRGVSAFVVLKLVAVVVVVVLLSGAFDLGNVEVHVVS